MTDDMKAAVDNLRAVCNQRIGEITRSAYRPGPNEPVVNPPVSVERVNELLRACDAVFRVADQGAKGQ